MSSAPSCGEQCFSPLLVKKNQAEDERKQTSHLKVTENAFDVTQDLLPVRPVGFQHLLHCLLTQIDM